MSPTAPRRLILGSTSAYRRELLSRFRLPFEQTSPDVDETPGPSESPPQVAGLLHTPVWIRPPRNGSEAAGSLGHMKPLINESATTRFPLTVSFQ